MELFSFHEMSAESSAESGARTDAQYALLLFITCDKLLANY